MKNDLRGEIKRVATGGEKKDWASAATERETSGKRKCRLLKKGGIGNKIWEDDIGQKSRKGIK